MQKSLLFPLQKFLLILFCIEKITSFSWKRSSSDCLSCRSNCKLFLRGSLNFVNWKSAESPWLLGSKGICALLPQGSPRSSKPMIQSLSLPSVFDTVCVIISDILGELEDIVTNIESRNYRSYATYIESIYRKTIESRLRNERNIVIKERRFFAMTSRYFIRVNSYTHIHKCVRKKSSSLRFLSVLNKRKC